MSERVQRAGLALLEVEVARDGDRATVTLGGELDMSTRTIADAALQGVRASRVRHLVVDLRALRFVGSTGLRLLLELTRACERDGLELTLVKGSPIIDRLVEITGVEDRLPFARPPSAA